MNVSEAVKEQYRSNSRHKNLVLKFPELDLQINHKDIHQDSIRLKESILDKESIEFVGCIVSIFQINVENLVVDVKGKKLEAEIYTDDTEDNPIPLFKGIVDSAVKQANRTTKEIVAYDELYTKGNINVAAWYKLLAFPITLKALRDSLFSYIGLDQEETELPNDGVQIKKKYNPVSLQAVVVMKSICQINGVFGIINRQGRFAYRIPSSGSTVQTEEFSFYKAVPYEEFTVRPVDMVTIRKSEDSEGVVYMESGSAGINNYIIQGNMFTYGLPDDVLLDMAERIYNSVSGFSYIPFESDNNGLPYIECGDTVTYTVIDYENSTAENMVYEQKSFYILTRELTGMQALRDTYSAHGEEYQTEFVTDLQTQIDLLKKKNTQNIQETQQQIEDYTYSRDEIDNMVSTGGTGSGGWDILSVPVLPTTIAANTIYLVQGEVEVT